MKIISLGLGVQSTALYYMSSMGELPRADYAIFADTGGEKSATIDYYHYLIDWKKKNNGIEIIRCTYKDLLSDLFKQTNSSNNRLASIPAFSQTGILRRQCTSEYKIAQVDRKIREIYELKPRQRFPKTEIWYGITSDEIQRLSIPVQKWKVNVYPLVNYKVYADGTSEKLSSDHFRRSDIVNWYHEKNLPIPEKSSCVFCPFQSDKNWLRLRQTAPRDFETAIRVDEKIRDSSKRGIKEKIYLHRSCKPLAEVEFDETQKELFEECSGNCWL